MRIHRSSESVREPLFLFRGDRPLKVHTAYRGATAGDAAAAVDLVKDLARPLTEQAAAVFGPSIIYLGPHAQEATGDNAIPQVLAEAIANVAQGRADRGIVQKSRVFHTGADPMERPNKRAQFDGEVRPGARYVRVDDVTTMGGTLAELADYIQALDGVVVGVAILVNAARSGRQIPDPVIIAELESRHGDAIQATFQINPTALTAEEAGYLIGFRTADEIRNRSTKAKQETDRRLRARGLE